MKHLLLGLLATFCCTSCSHDNKVASGFHSLKSRFFQSPEEQKMEAIALAIREGNVEKAEFEIAQLSNPFIRAQALADVAHYEIKDQNDLIGAKKTIEKLEQTIHDIPSKEDKLFSQIELADLKHFIDKKEAKKLMESLGPEVWLIVSPIERSRLLIRMITFQLETEKDAQSAKKTIEQTRQTIEFIKRDSIRRMRHKELENVLQVNNHILCESI